MLTRCWSTSLRASDPRIRTTRRTRVAENGSRSDAPSGDDRVGACLLTSDATRDDRRRHHLLAWILPRCSCPSSRPRHTKSRSRVPGPAGASALFGTDDLGGRVIELLWGSRISLSVGLTACRSVCSSGPRSARCGYLGGSSIVDLRASTHSSRSARILAIAITRRWAADPNALIAIGIVAIPATPASRGPGPVRDREYIVAARRSLSPLPSCAVTSSECERAHVRDAFDGVRISLGRAVIPGLAPRLPNRRGTGHTNRSATRQPRWIASVRAHHLHRRVEFNFLGDALRDVSTPPRRSG